MEYNYNVTGAERKKLVQAISKITGFPAKYQFMPTCSYLIEDHEVTKDGRLITDDPTLAQKLADLGFTAESSNTDEATEKSQPCEAVGFTVAIPLDKVKVGNLMSLLDAKGQLIKKALDVPELPVTVLEDRVELPWFDEAPAEPMICTRFISALCEMSVRQKRINRTEKIIENEKYAFRCFLLRLSFIGDEFKADRKYLLRNFEGSSAFRTVKKPA